MSANVQHVYLTSNDPSYPENRQNKFRSHLAVPVNCEQGVWLVGLESIQFPHTWNTIGTHEQQYVTAILVNGEAIEIPIPGGVFVTPAELQYAVNDAVGKVTEHPNKRRRRSLDSNESIPKPAVEDNESFHEPSTPGEDKGQSKIQPASNANEQTKFEDRKSVESNEWIPKPAAEDNERIQEPSTPGEGEKSKVQPAIQTSVKQVSTDSEEPSTPEETKTAEESVNKGESLEVSPTPAKQTPEKELANKGVSPEKEEPPTPEQSPPLTPVQGPTEVKKEAVNEGVSPEKAEPPTPEQSPKSQNKETIIYAYGNPSQPKQPGPPAQPTPVQSTQTVEPAQQPLQNVKKEEKKEAVKRPSSLNISPGGLYLFFLPDIGKFRFSINDTKINHIELSPQLGYALGFAKDQQILNGEVAKYRCDLNGGVNHLCVYTNVSENMIIGDKMASVLRIVSVNGKPGEVIERSFDPPIYHRVVSKSINEIEIEIHDIEGRPIPFDYGVVLIGLQFKKAIYF